MKINNLPWKVGDSIFAGSLLTQLGNGFSIETSRERKHLHFAVYKGTDHYFRGHEATREKLLSRWENPTEFLTKRSAEVPTPQPVSYEAAFAIFTNGTFRVFTAAMYHNRSADAYIQAQNPNLIHIRKANVTWGNFFDTLPFQLTRQCLTTGTKETFCTGKGGSLSFYLNGVKTDNLLDLVIAPGNRALITYPAKNDQEIQSQLLRVPTIVQQSK